MSALLMIVQEHFVLDRSAKFYSLHMMIKHFQTSKHKRDRCWFSKGLRNLLFSVSVLRLCSYFTIVQV